MEPTSSVWKNVGRLASTVKVAVKINITLLSSSYLFLAIPLYISLSGMSSATMETLSIVDVGVAAATLLLMLWVGIKIYAYTEVASFLTWASQEDGMAKDWGVYREFLLNIKKVAAEEKTRWAETLSQQQSMIRTTYSTKDFFGNTLPSLLDIAKQIDDAMDKVSEPSSTHADAIKDRLEQFMSLPQSIAPPFFTFALITTASLILTATKLISMAVS